MTLKFKLYGYETLGVFGHWEPFKEVKHYEHVLSLKELEDIKLKGKVTIYEKPYKSGFTRVEISYEDLQNGIEVEGDCYCRDSY